MKVLVITGDKTFGPGHARYELQRQAVEVLDVVYWGKGHVWPVLPKEHFDVVTAQDPFWRGLVAWRFARRLGAKLNIQVHTDLDAQPLLKHVLAQITLRHADSVRVVSEKLRSQVERVAPNANVHVLPIFIDIVPFAAVAPQAHEQKTVLWIGRFEAEKNPLAAIEIVKQIPHAHLVFLGKGSLEPALRAKAHGLPVEFAGWQDPKPFLARADAVLCTSLHESYGASIIEALAARVSVVAPDVGVAREAGAVVTPREELAAALKEVLESGTRGELKLLLPTAQKWAEEWVKTLQ